MEKSIEELIEISRFYGSNKEYVIAGGGNTSFKNEEFLWVKASGIPLAGINEDGFVCLLREKLRIISEKTYSQVSAERESQVKTDLYASMVAEGKRPSVESSLHDIIDYPFVVHTHPTIANALTCSVNSKKNTDELFGKDVLYIDYTDPGYVLFKKVAAELKAFKTINGKHPNIIFLENHGVFVNAGSIDEIVKLYTKIESVITRIIGSEMPYSEWSNLPMNLEFLNNLEGFQDVFCMPVTSPLIDEFLKSRKVFSRIQTAFTPDHIVYCKSQYLFLDDTENDTSRNAILAFRNKFGYNPKVIGIRNKGLIIVDENRKAAETVAELFLNMMKIAFFASRLGGSKPMTDEQIAFIENWEVENYRRSMAKK